MPSIRVNAFVAQEAVVITHHDRKIQELPPERAIDCGGAIAELGERILREQRPDSAAKNQGGGVSSGDSGDEENVFSEAGEREIAESSTGGEAPVQKETQTTIDSQDPVDECTGDTIEEGEENPREVTAISALSRGEVYVGTVDRISNSGNAIIECPSRLEQPHINVGPIDRSADGETVTFWYSGTQWCECLDEEYTYESYAPRDGMTTASSATSSSTNDRTVMASELPDSHNVFNPNGSAEGAENKNDLLNGH